MDQVAPNTNFFTNLFGVIAGNNLSLGRQSPNIDFIPLNGNNGTINISGRGQDAVWLGLRAPLQQKKAYENCYPVAAICDKLAEMDTNGVIKITKTEGKANGNDANSTWAKNMRARLEQPNALQSWEQFRGQQVVYKKVFGFCPVLPIVPAGMSPEYATEIINIPPWLFEPVIKQNASLLSSKIEEIIDHYTVTIFNSTFKLTPSQLFILEDSFMQDESRNFLLPLSRLVGCDMAVSNICAAMEADNVVLRRRGPLVVMTPTNKDVGGNVPMTPIERAEVQEDLAGYGITWAQFQYMISRNSMEVNEIGFNVSELGTKETVVAGEKALCHRYSFPYTLYEETEATYANGSNAAQSVYTDNVIPNNTKDLNKYNKFFKAADNGCKIWFDFSELHVLQEDSFDRERANYFQSQSLQIQWVNGMITRNQWLEAQGYEKLSPELGDVYYTSPEKPDPKQIDPNDPAFNK